LVDMDQMERTGIFNTQKVKNLLGKYLGKGQGPDSEIQNMAVVGILSTQMIHEQFVEGFADLQKQTPSITPDKVIRINGRGELTQTLAAS
ncbi:MAG: hypothetical protein K9J79_11705, partial [Desulfobacteraceae bacterium]|nr:hypothetical protein [Desulfobacteraceae bacterium]